MRFNFTGSLLRIELFLEPFFFCFRVSGYMGNFPKRNSPPIVPIFWRFFYLYMEFDIRALVEIVQKVFLFWAVSFFEACKCLQPSPHQSSRDSLRSSPQQSSRSSLQPSPHHLRISPSPLRSSSPSLPPWGYWKGHAEFLNFF